MLSNWGYILGRIVGKPLNPFLPFLPCFAYWCFTWVWSNFKYLWKSPPLIFFATFSPSPLRTYYGHLETFLPPSDLMPNPLFSFFFFLLLEQKGKKYSWGGGGIKDPQSSFFPPVMTIYRHSCPCWIIAGFIQSSHIHKGLRKGRQQLGILEVRNWALKRFGKKCVLGTFFWEITGHRERISWKKKKKRIKSSVRCH